MRFSLILIDAADAAVVAKDRSEFSGSYSEVEQKVCVVLRDVFGNPFRPFGFDPAWRTPNVLFLASQLYESRDFSARPILADALQDTGCERPDVLAHCQDVGPHVRGCWVADLVLGKE